MPETIKELIVVDTDRQLVAKFTRASEASNQVTISINVGPTNLTCFHLPAHTLLVIARVLSGTAGDHSSN